jgi:hypothetical protein
MNWIIIIYYKIEGFVRSHHQYLSISCEREMQKMMERKAIQSPAVAE